MHLEALTGDPDLYVCNRDARPTHESHTWRATGVGDDLIQIDPDEPNARPGAYFIGVFGLHASEFVLHSACVPKVRAAQLGATLAQLSRNSLRARAP